MYYRLKDNKFTNDSMVVAVDPMVITVTASG